MYKGEIYALLAALTWSIALILFKRSGEHTSPIVLNLFKNTVGLLLMFGTLCIFGEVLQPLALLSWKEGLWFCASGVLGIAIADSLLFASLNRIGVTRFTIVDCAYSPSIIFFSWMCLSEKVGMSHGIGAVLIISGILLSTIERRPAIYRDATESEVAFKKQLLVGIALGLAGILAMAYSIVMVKPTLEKLPLLWSSTGRLLVGTVSLGLWVAITQKGGIKKTFTPHHSWKFSISGAFLGTYIAMIFWLGGFKYANASTAGLINQSTLIFALPLSAWWLKESFTKQKVYAVILAASGVLVVTLKPL